MRIGESEPTLGIHWIENRSSLIRTARTLSFPSRRSGASADVALELAMDRRPNGINGIPFLQVDIYVGHPLYEFTSRLALE